MSDYNYKWLLEGKLITNSMKEISSRYVLVSKNDIGSLEKNSIRYITISEEASKCYFVKRGVKRKKFTEEQCIQIIKDKIAGLSYRDLSIKYKSSTRTIQDICKRKY